MGDSIQPAPESKLVPRVEYQIVTARHGFGFGAVERSVEEHLREGWVVAGGVSLTYDTSSKALIVAQALTRSVIAK